MKTIHALTEFDYMLVLPMANGDYTLDVFHHSGKLVLNTMPSNQNDDEQALPVAYLKCMAAKVMNDIAYKICNDLVRNKLPEKGCSDVREYLILIPPITPDQISIQCV